jgi:hypothetical protein
LGGSLLALDLLQRDGFLHQQHGNLVADGVGATALAADQVVAVQLQAAVARRTQGTPISPAGQDSALPSDHLQHAVNRLAGAAANRLVHAHFVHHIAQ